MLAEITIPEVQAHAQRARFFKENGRDLIEISFVGSKDNIIHKVTPDDMTKFRPEWDAYCDGRPLEKRTGTPLSDCDGMNERMAEEYVHKNVHNLEELAVLTDAQCQALGHGTLTLRGKAKALLAMREMRQQTERRDAIGKEFAKVGSVPEGDSSEVLAAIKEQGEAIKGLSDGIGALVALMTEQAKGKAKKATE